MNNDRDVKSSFLGLSFQLQSVLPHSCRTPPRLDSESTKSNCVTRQRRSNKPRFCYWIETHFCVLFQNNWLKAKHHPTCSVSPSSGSFDRSSAALCMLAIVSFLPLKQKPIFSVSSGQVAPIIEKYICLFRQHRRLQTSFMKRPSFQRVRVKSNPSDSNSISCF